MQKILSTQMCTQDLGDQLALSVVLQEPRNIDLMEIESLGQVGSNNIKGRERGKNGLLRRFHRHRGSLQLEPNYQPEEQPQRPQKQGVRWFYQDPLDVSPIDNIDMNISEMSNEDLFSTKDKCFYNTRREKQASNNPYFNQSLDITHNTLPQYNDFGPTVNQSRLFSTDTRRQKVQKYILKRSGRILRKKVSYECRKTAADSRLRVKGRFVTRAQAQELLGQNVNLMSNRQIKTLLEQHYQ